MIASIHTFFRAEIEPWRGGKRYYKDLNAKTSVKSVIFQTDTKKVIYMRYGGLFVARYAILHLLKPTRQSVVSSVEIASLLYEVNWKRAGSFAVLARFWKANQLGWSSRLVSCNHSAQSVDPLARA